MWYDTMSVDEVEQFLDNLIDAKNKLIKAANGLMENNYVDEIVPDEYICKAIGFEDYFYPDNTIDSKTPAIQFSEVLPLAKKLGIECIEDDYSDDGITFARYFIYKGVVMFSLFEEN